MNPFEQRATLLAPGAFDRDYDHAWRSLECQSRRVEVVLGREEATGILWVVVTGFEKSESKTICYEEFLVEPRRIELLTSAVRLQRSPI